MANHGRTPAGRELTDEVLEEMAAEAERGLDVSTAKTIRRGPGRPRIGAGVGEVFPVRLEPELRGRLDAKALEEGRPSAAVVRDALVRYLEPASRGRRQPALCEASGDRFPASEGPLIVCPACGARVKLVRGKVQRHARTAEAVGTAERR